MGDPATALNSLKNITTETFQSSIMGILAYPENERSIIPNLYAPYGWGLNWQCDPGQCQAIGCIGTGTGNNSKYVCDPRNGKLIEREVFNSLYRHENGKPISIEAIEKMPIVEQDSYIDALNNIGPWVLTDDMFTRYNQCSDRPNGCNQSNCLPCNRNGGPSAENIPNVFRLTIEKIKVSNPALVGNTNLKYAVSVNGTQGNNIVLKRNVRYYFYVSTNIPGEDNCNPSQAWMDTALVFSRQPVGSTNVPRMNNTIPMPVGNAFWLMVPTNWPGIAYIVANRDDIAGVAVTTLSGTSR